MPFPRFKTTSNTEWFVVLWFLKNPVFFFKLSKGGVYGTPNNPFIFWKKRSSNTKPWRFQVYRKGKPTSLEKPFPAKPLVRTQHQELEDSAPFLGLVICD